jgi:hypothetical protein
MTVLAVGSVAGSPGATSLAIGLTTVWPQARRRVLVEADPDGGRLGAELGIGVEPGLMALALAMRAGRLTGAELVEQGAADVGAWFAVPAPASGEQAHSALVHAAVPLAETMAADDEATWIVDTGRLSPRSPALPFARVADRALVVTAGSFAALQLVPHRVEALRNAGCRPGVVVVEPLPWPVEEVADFVGADVVAVLPRVAARRDGVAAMSASAWRPWWRRVEAAARYLLASTEHPERSELGAEHREVGR